MTLARRIFLEKRGVILPLLVAVVLNLCAYLFVVRPLGEKSAGAAERAVAASAGLRAAERDFAAAQALVSGKAQAVRELSTFYEKVLPASQSAARRLTFAALPDLASAARVTYLEGRYEIDQAQKKDAQLGHLRIRLVLEGEYDRVRQFVYAVETSPAFVIIDDVTLAQDDPGRPLLLTLDLSTYFRREANGN
jgi:Tfp pilus assembly protein PilO